MEHDKAFELLLIALGFAARALAGRKLGIWEEKVFDRAVARYVDPIVKRYIIRNERRLAIWLHHQLGHDGRNALLCENGNCAKVTPTEPQ
jgi:hypothetical protein